MRATSLFSLLSLLLLVVLPAAAATAQASRYNSHQSFQLRHQYGLKARHETTRSTSTSTSSHRKTQTTTTGAGESSTTRITNFSDDGNDPKERIVVKEFSVIMSPSLELDNVAQDEIHRLAEQVIVKYVTGQQVDDAESNNVTLEYVILGDMVSSFKQEATFRNGTDDERRRLQGTTTLEFDSGVASFVGMGIMPTEKLVNEWVQQAIDTALTERLQGTDLYYVDESTFVSGGSEQGRSVNEDDGTNGDDGPNAGVVAGSVLAGVAAVALIALFSVRRRRQSRVFDVVLDDGSNYKQDDDDDDKNNNNDGDTVNESYDATPTKQPRHSIEADSMSVSEWTVNTEAGDTTALKSINAKQMMVVVPAMVNTESFERERPVALRKDMLTSAWSGRASASRAVHSESVLQPSHFVASAERRVLDQEEDFSPDPSWNPEDNTVSDTTPGNGNAAAAASPFVFEQAHESPAMGEEIYLMPPSQIKNSRMEPNENDLV